MFHILLSFVNTKIKIKNDKFNVKQDVIKLVQKGRMKQKFAMFSLRQTAKPVPLDESQMFFFFFASIQKQIIINSN